MRTRYQPTAAAVEARESVARSLAEDLLGVEYDIERSLTGAARMLTVAMSRRSELEVSVHIGQRLVEESIELSSALAVARSRAAQLHDTMAATQRQLGVQMLLPNPGEKPPQGTEPFETMRGDFHRPSLAVVGGAAGA